MKSLNFWESGVSGILKSWTEANRDSVKWKKRLSSVNFLWTWIHWPWPINNRDIWKIGVISSCSKYVIIIQWDNYHTIPIQNIEISTPIFVTSITFVCVCAYATCFCTICLLKTMFSTGQSCIILALGGSTIITPRVNHITNALYSYILVPL